MPWIVRVTVAEGIKALAGHEGEVWYVGNFGNVFKQARDAHAHDDPDDARRWVAKVWPALVDGQLPWDIVDLAEELLRCP